jgi:DNA-directed RNA polymerase subunit RPC12/RpoP
MKNNSKKPIPKEEDPVTINKRRENYALSRDLQASENNEAIARRLLEKGRNLVKCIKCGKEFEAGIASEDDLICPDCK